MLTYTVKPNIYGGVAARLSRVPQLANITGLGTVIENPGLLRDVTVAMYRFALRKAHTVFCQNVSIQRFCEEQRIGRKRVLIPGSGVNLDWHTLQPYPQPEDNAHHAKLDALLEWLQAPLALRRFMRVWCGAEEGTLPAMTLEEWGACVRAARERLLAQSSLAERLLAHAVQLHAG